MRRVIILFIVAVGLIEAFVLLHVNARVKADTTTTLATNRIFLPVVAMPDDRPVLPIEVIGRDGYTQSVTLKLADPSGADRLQLQCHRCAYRDASKNPGRGAKASLRLNGGPWLPLTNQTVAVYPHEAAYGGLNGTYHTVRFTVNLTSLGTPGLRAGANTVEFRFNATDGFTSGFRILDLNLLKGGQKVLPASAFRQDDPRQWQAPLNTPQDIAAGDTLWHDAKLVERPGGPAMKASCASCHATGDNINDLKYFNYSNHSIVERSKFHGLSEQQAKQIASYIRSIPLRRKDGTMYAAPGRPWNPPYQPGPGLDKRPVEEWAAGAGLAWVLPNDSDMLPHFFPNGVTKDAIATTKTLNTREMPVAIQLPDWNEWLPETHPVDVFGEAFLTGTGYRNAYLNYLDMHTKLGNGGAEAAIANRTLPDILHRFISAAELIRRDIDVGTTKIADPDLGKRVTMHWSAVKQWELMQEYHLEDAAPRLYGAFGEVRSWPTKNRNVFEMAPHRTASNVTHYSFQDLLVGKYFSTAWYQLQVAINTGNRHASTLSPVDWNYQPNHVDNLHYHGGPAHPLRLAATFAKMYQDYDDGKPLGQSVFGSSFGQIHPARYAPDGGFSVFNKLDPTVRAQVYTALLGSLMDKLEKHQPSEWPRGSDRGRGQLEPADYVPKEVTDTNFNYARHIGRWADCWYTMIPRYRAAGVDEAVLGRMINWGQQMWPLGDWAKLKR